MKNICSVLQGGEVLHAGATDALVSSVQPDGATLSTHHGVSQRRQGGHQGLDLAERNLEQREEGVDRAVKKLRPAAPAAEPTKD